LGQTPFNLALRYRATFRASARDFSVANETAANFAVRPNSVANGRFIEPVGPVMARMIAPGRDFPHLGEKVLQNPFFDLLHETSGGFQVVL
jgi:hypothetical protein